MNEKIEAALNKQLNNELAAEYAYLAMSADLTAKCLRGLAGWLRQQAQQERMHAMKLFDFINDRKGRVRLEEIPTPQFEWSSALAAFEDSYAREVKTSKEIDQLVEMAATEKDHAADAFLQWFVAEQVQEEATIQGIVDKLRLAGDDPAALLMLEEQLGQPTATTGGE
jgi:ferritin